MNGLADIGRPFGGFVSLVGAGPGDPELLTRKAERRLVEAEVVLHDALVPEAILKLAPRALRASVGKRAGRPSTSQEKINALLISFARRGKRVVRLKGGDPFVFGRGGEEALALAAGGIPFEIVPGISSALAAPALAGIPITHRGVASGFTVVAGQSPSSYEPILAGLSPNALTLVVLMGLGARREIARFLIAHGWKKETPAAIVLSASTPDEERWLGTLAGLALDEGTHDRPGVLTIGAVVSLAERIAPGASRAGADDEVPQRRSHVHGR
ncbi:MAG: uroporphyrinogen-III C-methyltransferase [Thermoanaerobaculia bacterium]